MPRLQSSALDPQDWHAYCTAPYTGAQAAAVNSSSGLVVLTALGASSTA